MPRNRPGEIKTMKDYGNLDNSQIAAIIDERIHHERNREILKRRLIDGLTYERLAEIFDLSVRQTKNIIYKAEDKLFR